MTRSSPPPPKSRRADPLPPPLPPPSSGGAAKVGTGTVVGGSVVVVGGSVVVVVVVVGPGGGSVVVVVVVGTAVVVVAGACVVVVVAGGAVVGGSVVVDGGSVIVRVNDAELAPSVRPNPYEPGVAVVNAVKVNVNVGAAPPFATVTPGALPEMPISVRSVEKLTLTALPGATLAERLAGVISARAGTITMNRSTTNETTAAR